MADEPAYPARLEVDYPEDGLSRATTAFRLILAIPLGAIIALLAANALDFPWLSYGLNRLARPADPRPRRSA